MKELKLEDGVFMTENETDIYTIKHTGDFFYEDGFLDVKDYLEFIKSILDLKCIVCDTLLKGKERKFCSGKCRNKHHQRENYKLVKMMQKIISEAELKNNN